MKASGQWMILVSLAGILFIFGCTATPGTSEGVVYLQLEGRTMGTTYVVQYADSLERNFAGPIDSLLKQLNEEVSTYIPSSAISTFNQTARGISLGFDPEAYRYSGTVPDTLPADYHFIQNYQLSKWVSEQSGGSFDPTVMPLVNYWGFGYTEKKPVTEVDSLKIDSLMHFVGLDKIRLKEDSLIKTAAGVQLDFSGVAKGYGVDLVGRFLELQGIRDYMVEIGGEVRTRGLNPRGRMWRIGILQPKEGVGNTDFEAKANLADLSLATSGNYRNYYEVDGRKYAHTINPRTGYPERTNLLSASVFASDCAEADAWATAFMVMGLNNAWPLAERLDGVEAFFIFGREDGSMGVQQTSGLQQIIEQ